MEAVKKNPRLRIGQSEIQAVRAMTERLSDLDDDFGGRYARPMDAAFLVNTVTPYLKADTSSEARKGMLSAASFLCYLTGWMAVDEGAHGRAQQYYVKALELAGAGGDHKTTAASYEACPCRPRTSVTEHQRQGSRRRPQRRRPSPLLACGHSWRDNRPTPTPLQGKRRMRLRACARRSDQLTKQKASLGLSAASAPPLSRTQPQKYDMPWATPKEASSPCMTIFDFETRRTCNAVS